MQEKPEVGQMVQYFTNQTREKGPSHSKLPKPIPVGPLAAVVTEVQQNGTLNLIVWMPRGHMYPAFNVTEEPTTPVQHLWRPIPRRLENPAMAMFTAPRAVPDTDLPRAVPNGLPAPTGSDGDAK